MNFQLLFTFLLVRSIYAVTYNPFEGTSMKSFVRGSSSSSQSFTISKSDFYDAAFIGYFKFNSISVQSLMKLQISSESYSFLHLYINSSSKPTIKVIYDELNIQQTSSLSTSVSSSTWYLLGIGYKYSTKTSYIIYQNGAYIVNMQSLVSSNQIASRISSLELCIACQPVEYAYNVLNGVYSSIKMLTKFEILASNIRFFQNEFEMSTALLRESYLNTANLQTYTISKNSNFSLICSSSSKIFFDGVCIDKAECANIQYQSSNQFGNLNNYYYDLGQNKCLVCDDNCKLCNSDSTCAECNHGYIVNSTKCKRCDQGYFYDELTKSCSATCQTGYYQDQLNQICIQQFDAYTHQLNPLLVKRSFNQNDGFALIDIPTSATLGDKITQCHLDINSYGPYTFLGGYTTLKTEKLTKQFLGMPNSAKKVITFQFLVYNGGNQNDISLLVNKRIITQSSYFVLQSSQTFCTDNQVSSLFQLTYEVSDSSVDFDITLISSKDGWGIRNFQMSITKCHPTCNNCSADGKPWQCSTCEKYGNTLFLNNQCACSKGNYASFENCYSSPCYSCQACPLNCSTCEDLTGKCTSCNSGYSIQNGLCVAQTTCTNLYLQDSLTNYCIKGKDLGLSHFGNDKIVQYLDYWNFSSGSTAPFSCYSRQYAPALASTNTATLNIQLQNYMSYHFQIDISLSVTNVDYFAPTDYVNYFVDSIKERWSIYTATTSMTNGCEDSFQFEQQFSEVFSKLKSSNSLVFLIESNLTTIFPKSSDKFTFNDFLIYYQRCHASCSSCSNTTNQCTGCISNASLNASKGTLCYCNDGYHFKFDWNTSLGQCLSCNNACQTCNGPQITDCLTCFPGYTMQSGICVNSCLPNQYYDQAQSKCVTCSECCLTCKGPTQNDCLTCDTNFMSYISNKCYFNSDGSYCSPCSSFSGGYCGGSQTNQSFCENQGWILQNSNTCMQCSKTNGSSLCGGNSSNNTICNQYGYYYNSGLDLCMNCAIAVGTECGDVSIRTKCKSNKWIYSASAVKCINCDLNSSDPLCGSCDASCLTCFGAGPDNCSTCSSPKILVNNKCLDDCPNGFQKIAGQCQICSNPSACMPCSATCETCQTLDTTKCISCYPSMNLSSNQCTCKDPEDTRNNFFECSYQNQAVLDIKLSNSDPILTIDFGKVLNELPNHVGENSKAVCSELFDSANLNKIGMNSVCKINLKQIIIELDNSSEIMEGDTLTFKSSVLKFKNNSSVSIDTFLNNIVIQETPVNTIVAFTYDAIGNTCYDYKITLEKIENDSKRGFMTISWTLLNPTTDDEDIEIANILSLASANKYTNISIVNKVIPANKQKMIKVEYLLKNSVQSNQVFTFQLKSFKKIRTEIQSTLKQPYYRFQDFVVSLAFYLDYCNDSGDYIPNPSNTAFDVTISSPQSSQISINSQGLTKNEITFNVDKYSFEVNIDSEINAQIQLTSDTSVSSTAKLKLKFEPSQLITKIVGGDRKQDYRNKLVLKKEVRDLDMQDSTVDQQITTTWSCYDPADITKLCAYQNGNIINLNSLQNKEIPGGTFNPYTAIKISLIGQKDTRSFTHSVIIFFLEFDLPNLDVTLSIIDPFVKTVNLNEEIFATLDYDKAVNTDILSFSSTIVYENEVVGAIKFDYTKLRFQLWDYYSQFDRSKPQLQIRFSVFNPFFFMPSSQIINIQINFPPEQCVFSVSPLPNQTNPVYSLATFITLSITNCKDDHLPLSYQFFMYLTQADLDHEIKNPKQIKRRQLNNQSSNSQYQIILPPGDLVLMAVVSDSLQAVYNTTVPIKVTQSIIPQSDYITLIDSILNLSNTVGDELIPQFSLLAEDLSKRTDLVSDSAINAKKIQIINAIKKVSSTLSSFSTFATMGDKAIQSLYQSGLTLNESDEKQQLTDMQATLSEDWSQTPYESLSDVQKTLRQQQMYDYFQIIDKLAANSGQNNLDLYNLQIDITKAIGEKMNQYSLPNEDSKLFKGTKLEILTQQVTDKNLCNYLFCNSQSSDSSSAPQIYNVVYKTHMNNPYSQDETFKNFTKTLSEKIGIKNPTQFPIVVPSITQHSGRRQRVLASNSLISSNSIALTFKGEEQENLSCLTKNSDKWSQKGCKLVYNKNSKLYSCICDSPSPTTIVDDLESLYTNKNLQTAFGSDGLNNLANFTNFYEYIAFWLIVFNTLCFIILYIKGKQLDQQTDQGSGILPQTNKVYPTSQIENKQVSYQNINHPQNQVLSLPQTTNEFNQLSKAEFRPRKIKNKTIKSQNLLKINTQDKNDGVLNDISPLTQVDQNDLARAANQPKSNLKIMESHNQIISVQRKTSIMYHMKDGPHSDVEMKDDHHQENILEHKPPTQSIQSLKFIDLSDDEYNEKKKKFLSLNPIKQMIYFHNLFGIFLVYNHELPRNLRFSCFYVRLIHSFAISIIFDQNYNYIQLIVISIGNSILILICLEILEILSKKLGRIALAVVLLSLLGFYYYLILAIVSGQEPSESNYSMLSYLMFTLCDLLVISFISAAIQRFIALSTMKKQKLQSCSQRIFEFLHIQLILKSIL